MYTKRICHQLEFSLFPIQAKCLCAYSAFKSVNETLLTPLIGHWYIYSEVIWAMPKESIVLWEVFPQKDNKITTKVFLLLICRYCCIDDLNTLPFLGSTIEVGHLLLPLVGEEFTKLELPALDVEQSVHTETRLRHKLVARMTSRCCLVHLKKQFHASSQVMFYLCLCHFSLCLSLPL